MMLFGILLLVHYAVAWPTSAATKTTLAPKTCSSIPSPTYGTFSFTQISSNRYATAIPSPTKPPASTYGPAFAQASTLLDANLTYTTYSLDRSATGTEQYGAGQFASIWQGLSYSNTIPFTTTVSPTPVPTSELVFPPSLYNYCSDSTGCTDGYCLPEDFVGICLALCSQYQTEFCADLGCSIECMAD